MAHEGRIVHHRLRRGGADLRPRAGRLADRNPARPGAAQFLRLGFGAHDADVEVRGPVAGRIARRLVPIVLELLVDQHRPLAGHEPQERARRARERHPGLEVRLRAERIRLVVAEHDLLVAREDDRAVEPGRAQRVVEPLVHDREVRAVFAFEPRAELFGRADVAVDGGGANGADVAQPFARFGSVVSGRRSAGGRSRAHGHGPQGFVSVRSAVQSRE